MSRWSPTTLADFLARCEPEPNSGCWLWTGPITTRGYGQFWLNGRRVTAHRYAYETFVKAVPSSLTLDHLCRVRWKR